MDSDLDHPVVIPFELTTHGGVRIAIHDSKGADVREMINRELGPGNHELVWDGRDDRGELVPNGVYFASLELRGRIHTRRIDLQR